MPDYCDNDLSVSHSDPRMMFKFIKAVRSRHVEGLGWDGPGLFMAFNPIPHEVRYAWRVDGPEAALKGLDLSRLGFQTAIRRYPALEEGGDRVEHLVASHRSLWASLTLRWALLGSPLRVTAGPRRALSWDAETAAERWGSKWDVYGADFSFRIEDDFDSEERLSRIAQKMSAFRLSSLMRLIAPLIFRGSPLEAFVRSFDTPWDPPIGFYETLHRLGFRVCAAYNVRSEYGGEFSVGTDKRFVLDFDDPNLRRSYRAWLETLENPELVESSIDFDHHYSRHLEELEEELYERMEAEPELDVFSWDWSAPGGERRVVQDCPACKTRTDHLVNLRTRDHRCLLCGWDQREAYRETLLTMIDEVSK